MPNNYQSRREAWNNGGMFAVFETMQPQYTPDTAARDAFVSATRSNRDFYNANIRSEAMRIRNIGLGFGEANAYNASRDAIGRTGRFFDHAQESMGRDQARYGRVVDADTQQSQQRRLGLARIISQVDASNKAVRNAEDIRKNAQLLGTQMYGDLTGGAGGLLAQLAAGENDRENQVRGFTTQSQANNSASAGAGIGTLISAI